VSRIEHVFAKQSEVIESRTSALADTLHASVENAKNALVNQAAGIEAAFAEQTGVIEERTRTMENALRLGVDNVKGTLERSAVVVAGSLRDKVMEATAGIGDEAERALTEADARIAARTQETVEALSTR